MGVTLELRWFLRKPPCPREVWFGARDPSPLRVDWYAFPCDARSGVKVREGRIEVKLRLEECGDFAWGGVCGRLERWSKSSVALPPSEIPQERHLAGAGWKAVVKTRWQRIFELESDTLCETQVLDRSRVAVQFEWTELAVASGASWWTIGLEAYGDAAGQDRILRLAAAELFSLVRSPAGLTRDVSCGYPEWLGQVFGDAPT